ncbi:MULTISPECIES: hypothetical protein [Parabacteroides]
MSVKTIALLYPYLPQQVKTGQEKTEATAGNLSVQIDKMKQSTSR